MNTIIQNDCPDECLKQANKLRRDCPNKWLFLQIECKGQTTLCKTFGTSIQILRKNGINHHGGWDLSVKDWKKQILTAVKA